jgi:hypothetical protein
MDHLASEKADFGTTFEKADFGDYNSVPMATRTRVLHAIQDVKCWLFDVQLNNLPVIILRSKQLAE